MGNLNPQPGASHASHHLGILVDSGRSGVSVAAGGARGVPYPRDLSCTYSAGTTHGCSGHRLHEPGHTAGPAATLAGGLAGRAGQDVPAAQVAGHRRAGAVHPALAGDQGPEVGGRLGLDSLLSGGGMSSMLNTVWLILSAM